MREIEIYLSKLRGFFETLYRQGEVFGYRFMFQCLFRRIISFKWYEEYIYKYLTKYFISVIKEFKTKKANLKSDNIVEENFHIWTLWWQGEKEAPEIVKLCIESQRNNLVFPGIEYHILTSENWNEYIEIPRYILEKVERRIITLTHFSDIIRVELLRKYGGIWIDATVLCTQPVDIRKYSNPFFTVKVHEKSEFYTLKRWTGFFIGDEKNSILFDFMAECFRYYWKLEENLIVYLLIDYLIAIAYEQFAQVKAKIDKIPTTNRDLWFLLRKMNCAFDSDEWNRITKTTYFFKLSYKEEFNGGSLVEKIDNGKLTYWGFIKQTSGDVENAKI